MAYRSSCAFLVIQPPFVQMMLAIPALLRLAEVCTKTLPGMLTSRQKLQAVLQDRHFQYGAKLWFCAASVFAAVVVIQQDYSISKRWSPYYGFITIPIVFAERVRRASLFKRMCRTSTGVMVSCTWCTPVAVQCPLTHSA